MCQCSERSAGVSLPATSTMRMPLKQRSGSKLRPSRTLLGRILAAGRLGCAVRTERVEKLPHNSLRQGRSDRAVAARPDLLVLRHVEGAEDPVDDRQVGDVILVDRLFVARMMPMVVARLGPPVF